LALALVRDKDNVIEYQIPITGNLKNPKFHLHEIVFNTLRNIFVKPATTPYRLEVKKQENVIDKSINIEWGTGKSSVTQLQEKFIGKMAKFLAQNPAASIKVNPCQYSIKEKEYILFFEAKKKYYLSCHPGKAKGFDKSDSELVDKMSVKDSSFVHYLNRHLNHTLIFTIQEKCKNIVDTGIVNRQFSRLNRARGNIFLSYFKNKGVEGRVKFNPTQNTIPYNGFSYYKIEYNGELPEYLLKAYNKMNELNNESPRVKYKQYRRSISSAL
jgi:hypothetical protein